MKNITMHAGTLEVLERMKNSVNGNPRFRCYVNGVSFVTKPDSAYSYDIENLQGKAVKVSVGTHYGKATLSDIQGV